MDGEPGAQGAIGSKRRMARIDLRTDMLHPQRVYRRLDEQRPCELRVKSRVGTVHAVTAPPAGVLRSVMQLS